MDLSLCPAARGKEKKVVYKGDEPMKRYVDFFRIKIILVIAIIVFPIVFIVTLVNALSPDHGDFWPSITYENAPENTAYVDILIKLPENSEDYVDFAKWENPPQLNPIGYKEVTEQEFDSSGNVVHTITRTVTVYEKELSITPDSEIAKLNADGYVSLSVHYAGSRGFRGTELNLSVHGGSDIVDIKKRYGKFKAAYVDENGNVLGITKAARTRYNPKEASSFSAKGDKLIFTKYGCSPLHRALIYVSFFGGPLSLIALIVCIVLDIRQNKKLYLPPRPNSMPRSIEERNKDNNE